MRNTLPPGQVDPHELAAIEALTVQLGKLLAALPAGVRIRVELEHDPVGGRCGYFELIAAGSGGEETELEVEFAEAYGGGLVGLLRSKTVTIPALPY